MASGEKGRNGGRSGDRKGDATRAERLRAALRENLKRRKAQARQRSLGRTAARGSATIPPESCRKEYRTTPRIEPIILQVAVGGEDMDRIRIAGGRPLNGSIPISGAKNATLPLMIASLLTDQTLILDNVPRLADVNLLQRILSNHGVDMMVPGKRPGELQEFGHTIHIVASRIVDTTAPYDLVSKMRASFWVIAPLLARMGEAKVSLPGGCAIGTRPVDLLIMAMEKFGAQIDIDAGYVIARAKNGLKGGEIKFSKVTVSGTHTALMAAVLAQGTTVIENAAQEPEIGDVADCLNKMGARISGIGTSRLIVEGVTRLGGARHRVLPDRIETGTYAMAVAMTGGDVLLEGARPELLQSALDVIKQTGAEITAANNGIRVRRNGTPHRAGRCEHRAVPRIFRPISRRSSWR